MKITVSEERAKPVCPKNPRLSDTVRHRPFVPESGSDDEISGISPEILPFLPESGTNGLGVLILGVLILGVLI